MYSPFMYKKYVFFMAIANTLQFLKISFEDTKKICKCNKNDSVIGRQTQVRKKYHSLDNFIEYYDFLKAAAELFSATF